MGVNIKIKRKFFSSTHLFNNIHLRPSIKWFLFILCIFIIQSKISIFGYHLNLAVLVVYAFVIHSVRKTAKKEELGSTEWEIKCSAFGAFIGILDDIISSSIIGPSFLSKALVGFFGAVLFGNIFFRWTPLLGFIVIFFLTTFDGIAQLVIRIIITDFKIGIYNIAQMVLLQAIINTPFSILFKPDER